jgi:hypothetical protein
VLPTTSFQGRQCRSEGTGSQGAQPGFAGSPWGGHFAVNGRCTPLVFHTLMKESFEAEIRLPAHRRRSGGGQAEVGRSSGGAQAEVG